MTKFTLYAVDCVPFGGLPSEHAFVLTADGHNFNCFGRGGAPDGARAVCEGNGSAKWASSFYGLEGPVDSSTAAGLHVRYDGVCQTAANRVLVLAGDFDARGTKGNVFATLMFGRFGFNIQPYVDAVTNAGNQLLKDSPGEIQAADIQNVLQRIAYGQTPDGELDMLHADAKEQFNPTLPDVTDAQRVAFRPIYATFQSDRLAAFTAIATKVPVGQQIAYDLLPASLIAPWGTCVDRLVAALDATQFQNIFGVTPDEAKKHIS